MDDVRDKVQDLIFGAGDADEDQNDAENDSEGKNVSLEWTKESAYVEVLERAIVGIKATEENKLFEPREWEFLSRIAELESSQRFLLIRLVLRKKPGGWYRLRDISQYTSEIGGKERQEAAFKALSKPFDEAIELADVPSTVPRPEPLDVKVKEEEREIIDLTLDSDDEEDVKPVIAGPSKLPPAAAPVPPAAPQDDRDDTLYFAQNERELSLLEGLRTLTMDELKGIGKTLKRNLAKKTKDELITELMNSASGQTLLAFTPSPAKGKGKGKQADSKLKQSVLPFATPKMNRIQTDRLKELMLQAVGKCLRLNPFVYTLILRVHIIWFRSTEIPEALFSPALLASFKKQVYAEYEHRRDPTIWPGRDAFLEYEEMLNVERIVDELLVPEPKNGGRASTAAPPQVIVPPSTPGFDKLSPVKRDVSTLLPGQEPTEDNPNLRKMHAILELVRDRLLEQFKQHIILAKTLEDERKPEFVRFESGYILTRILAKCLHAAGTLKEYEFEEEIILLLMSQRRWGRRRRGRLYDRLALIRMRYLLKDSEGKKDMDFVRAARECLMQALNDPDVPEVLKPTLIHRLLATEKMLRLPADQRADYEDVTLQKPPEVNIVAVRVWEVDLPDDLKEKENKPAAGTNIASFFLPTRAPRAVASAEAKKRPWTGKSYWEGNDGPVHVEIRAIEHYAQDGFKGLHSETQILTTLFGLLFWDIIFAKIPGAFETPFQRGPLDLAEESFYFLRAEAIEKRLADIRDGHGRAILETNDLLHREKKTCCVGVNWQMCGREDLLEIVECLGGKVLSALCRLFCEDYAGRSSGVPDLVIWKFLTKEIRFVEVKGPGDSLQENQKLWCHALLSINCAVEVCHVMEADALEKKERKLAEKEAKKEAKKEKKTPRKRRASAAATAGSSRKKTKFLSEEPEPESEEDQLKMEDDEADWIPQSQAVAESAPRRASKRHRSADANDDDEEPPTPLMSRAKRRKTV
ncbi:Fanconi-associated nuclease [Mycena chlorophos]|uniref:Fanconi-associated nuclease n=1 Tax=Mycena chlorophos TaxID=658473 RepID=A0A8H6W022_MYCCL|nr:Fanconi-associated nuclease [Mycena chlorophos]